MGLSELVGRDAELTVLRRALEQARSGLGAVVLVTGEAGIGKSRLLRELAREASGAGVPVLSGRGVPDGGAYRPVAEALLGYLRDTAVTETPELRPFRSALARLVPGWSGADPVPASEPAVDPVVVLGEGLLRLLRRIGAEDGCLVLLDDLHWADADSVALVEFLAGAVGSSRILLVAAARTGDGGAVDRLDVTTLALDRLGRQGVAELAANRVPGEALAPAVHDLLADRSEGLPLAVEELLAGLIDSGALRRDGSTWLLTGEPRAVVPDGIASVVTGRLRGLADEHRRVVEAAAVLGREVDWALLPQVADLPEDAALAGLRAAADAHLLVPAERPGRLGWRHGLIRDAVLARLGPAEHGVLARRAGEALSARYQRTGSADDAAAAVALFVRAVDGPRAARLLADQARQAIAVGALRTADEQLAHALRIAGDPAGLAADRVRVLTLSGRLDEAFEVGAEVLDGMSGDPHANLCFQLATAGVAAGRWEQASRFADRAGRPGDARALAVAADVAFGSGRAAEAELLALRAVDAAERDGMPEQCCAALEVLGRCARQADPDAAAVFFGRAAQLAAEHGMVPARISALLAIGTTELLRTDSSVTLLEARELALDAGMLGRVCDIDQLRTDCAAVIEGPVAAAEIGRRTAELAAGLRLHRIQSMTEMMAAAGAGLQGDPAGMAAALDAAASRPGAPVEATAARPFIEAMVPLVGHDLPRARDLLDRGIELLSAHESTAPIGHWGLWVLVRTVLDDRADLARETLRHAPQVLRTINASALGFADAVAAGRAGRPDEADALLAAADAMLPTQHWWRRLLRLLAAEAAIADGWGDPVAMLRADLSAFESDGDQLARTCRTLLRRAGVTVRRGRGSTAVPPALRSLGVTSREMDVLGLVADRLTNLQVAERLFLSPRTVETHVTSLLAKTGTASRADLVAYAARAAR